MNYKENDSKNLLEKLLQNHGDILDQELDCTKCNGSGEKKIYYNRIFIEIVTCKYCKHGKINLLKIYREETINQIKQRLMINFSKPINDELVKQDFTDCINMFLSGEINVPNYLKQKLSSSYSRYSINKFIEKKWKKSKKKIENLLDIYLQYFLRTPTFPQTRRIKNVTGIGKNWYRLTMDYYQCSRKITAADEKFEDNKQQFENYSDVDESKRSELLKNSSMSTEDILRESFIEQLSWCIEKNPQIYEFNEKEILFLNIESQKILMSKLKISQSTHAKEFFDGWKNTLRNHMESLYEIDPKLFEDNFNKLKNDHNPSDIIKKILNKDGTKFNPMEDANGLCYEYKASTFATQKNIDQIMHEILKKKNVKLNPITDKKITEKFKNESTILADSNVMNKILKTIVAFLNNDKDHGIILIGVEDNGDIRGIESLHGTYNTRYDIKADTIDKFLDNYRRYIQLKISDSQQPSLDTNFKNDNISVRIIPISKINQKILVINVKPNGKEVCYFMEINKRYPQSAKHIAYVRKNGMNVMLDGKPLEDLIKKFANN